MAQTTKKTPHSSHIVKRQGHTEPFDDRKLYASLYASCLALNETDVTAEIIADRVTKEIDDWMKKKHEVTSHEIRVHAAHHLKVYHPDAAWIYLHHRNIN